MRISLLAVKNFQGVQDVEISPGDKNLILIAGKNRQGKSSTLRAMSAALGGGKEKPVKPVRDGEETAEITIELDDGQIVIVKEFDASGKATLEVRSGVMGKVTSPQKVLDGIVGTRFLDPLAFTRLSEKAQRAALLEVVDLDIDLHENSLKRKAAFDQRTDVNRSVKRLRAEYGAFADPGEIPERIDIKELVAQMHELRVVNDHLISLTTKSERIKGEIGDISSDVEGIKSAIIRREEEHRVEIAKLKESLRATIADLSETQNLLKESEEERDQYELDHRNTQYRLDTIEEQIAESDDHNTKTTTLQNALEARAQIFAKYKAEEKRASKLTKRIEEFDTARATALEKANMPVPGLGIEDSCVLFNAIPLSQASGAEQLQISLAIAASTSPQLRDIWIEDGALLDSDSLKQVSDFAESNNLRVWLERVGDSDDDCIVIEEGKVKNQAKA